MAFFFNRRNNSAANAQPVVGTVPVVGPVAGSMPQQASAGGADADPAVMTPNMGLPTTTTQTPTPAFAGSANGYVNDGTANTISQPMRGPADLQAERQRLIDRIGHLSPATDAYATEFVDGLMDFAIRSGTSDIHLQPNAEGFDVRFRDDGILKPLGIFAAGANTSIVSRLKVLANLLTYQSDVPQEGRIAVAGEGGGSGNSNGAATDGVATDGVATGARAAEARLSTFPTLHGERAVLRFFSHHGVYSTLDDLGHSSSIVDQIRDTLAETSGAFLICGPAGSGKSTTLYATLRHLTKTTGRTRSILTVEDPIEVPLDGVSQSQVNAPAGFDLHTALKSLLRQDPEVFCVGEIRDPLTAEMALQACLAGQLMIATFHADSVATAITRLIDMGMDPYQMRSGLIGIVCQRLVRKLCDCARWSDDEADRQQWSVDRVRAANGCERCFETGYSGRTIISEFLSLREGEVCDQLIGTLDSRKIYRQAVESGMTSLWENADQLIRDGVTSPGEIRRVLGQTMRM